MQHCCIYSYRFRNFEDQFYLQRMFLNLKLGSDQVGAIASGLCVIHCIATPFLFVVQSCSVSNCCDGGPTWWSSIDYLFIIITLFAVLQSAKTTSKDWMKKALISTWVVLTLMIIYEKIGIFPISEWWKYMAAFAMVSLHLYNLRFCQCKEEDCCLTSAQ